MMHKHANGQSIHIHKIKNKVKQLLVAKKSVPDTHLALCVRVQALHLSPELNFSSLTYCLGELLIFLGVSPNIFSCKLYSNRSYSRGYEN